MTFAVILSPIPSFTFCCVVVAESFQFSKIKYPVFKRDICLNVPWCLQSFSENSCQNFCTNLEIFCKL